MITARTEPELETKALERRSLPASETVRHGGPHCLHRTSRARQPCPRGRFALSLVVGRNAESGRRAKEGEIDGRELLDLVHESIYARDLEGRITFWNSAAGELYGWTREQALGRYADELLKCTHPVSIEALTSEVLAVGRWRGEFSRVTADGSAILVDARWSLRRHARGSPIGIVETGRDVTEKRKADNELALSERRYRGLFNYMPIALWQLDTRKMGEMFETLRARGVGDFRAYVAKHPEFLDEAVASISIVEANEETLKLFGGTELESLLPLMPSLWLSKEHFLKATLARLSGANSYVAEAALQTVDGRRVDVMHGVAFADPDNPDTYNLVGAVDITENKRSAAALAQSELKYRDLFEHMPIALAQLDVSELAQAFRELREAGVTDLADYMDERPETLERMLQLMRIEQVNQHTVKMFGGKDSADFVGPIARFWRGSEETMKRSLTARFGGAELYAEETRLQTLDGRAVDVFYTSAFPKALSALGIGLVGMVDVGDRVEVERMLQQVRADLAHAARVATLGELTASIAHEVNQPLAAITTNGEASLRWLARDKPEIEEVRTLAARIVADARRAADVISRIRNIAAPQPPEQLPLSVNVAVEEVVRFLRHEFSSNQVAVELDLARDLPDVRADRTQLQQVLVNLLVNAMQAMSQLGTADPHIRVRTASAQGGRVQVDVEDNGPGIPTEDIPRLFDSFFTTKEGGLGIGLSICRSIMEAHSGQISCANHSLGARFSLTLPAAENPSLP
jgi:PAS domain S-box-containing protein